jgi:energy-coupling factor transport system ATP-binding protein
MRQLLKSITSDQEVRNLDARQESTKEQMAAFRQDSKDIIRVKNISHVYMAETTFERHALNNISLSVKTGEIFGIIGHTGSGKTTLVQHFNGILKATSGSIEVDGLEAS